MITVKKNGNRCMKLDTAAADEFQDFETESLDIEDLG